MQDHLYLILKKLLVKNNININEEELKLQISSHPSYPSLHSVTGVLGHFSIPNIAVRLTPSLEIVHQLPDQFIAVLSSESGEEIVYVQRANDNIQIINEKNKKQNFTPSQFVEEWNGIIIAIEKDENIVEAKNNPFLKIVPFISIVIVAIIGIWFFTESSLFASWNFVFSIIGLTLSILLVQQELGIQSSTTNKFCNLSEGASCDAVLQSKGATLFGIFKLSDISLVTFSAYILILLFFSLKGIDNLSLIAVLSLASIPFVGYAINYQAAIIKKWCPLCLGIAGVLIFQVKGVFIFGIVSELTLTITPTLIIAISFAIVLALWLFIKPIIKDKSELKQRHVEFMKLKRDFDVFNSLLLKGSSLRTSPEINNEIVLGDNNAPLTLTLVTSPLCFYCKAAHTDITKILRQANGKVKINLRFNVDTENKEQDLYKIVSQLLYTYQTEGQDETMQLLHHLYDPTTSIRDWIQKTNIHTSELFDQVMHEQLQWSNDNNINFTPAFYLGDHAFPSQYKRDELLYFIDELIKNKFTHKIKNEARIAS